MRLILWTFVYFIGVGLFVRWFDNDRLVRACAALGVMAVAMCGVWAQVVSR